MFKRVWGVTWFAIRAMWDELMMLSGMGFLWFLMALGLPYGVFSLTTYLSLRPELSIALTAVSLSMAPPATAALFHVAWYLARERRIEFAYFWQGFREYFWPSWKVSGVMLVALAILLADLFFFFRAESVLLRVLGFVMLWVLAFWIAVQVYLYPLLIALEKKRLGTMLKNSAQLVMAFPLFCLLVWVVAILLTALGVVTLVPLATFWMPLIAVLFSRAFVSSWDEAVRIQQQYQAQETQENE